MDAGIIKSKSNSLKRLDEVTSDNQQQSIERKRLETAQQIMNVSNIPSESELKALDLQKEEKIKNLQKQ